MGAHFLRRDACPCCASPKTTELCRAPYREDPLRAYLVSFYEPQGGVEFAALEGQDFVLHECVDCGLVFQAEIPDDALLAALYERWIDPARVYGVEERGRRVGYFSRLAREIERIGTHFDRPTSELRLLDFGMGWGHWCHHARAFGYQAYGADLAPSRIEHAQRIGVPVLDTEQIAERRFHFVNAEQVLEHLPQPRATLSQLASALEPDGLLRIAVPDGWDVRRRIEKWDWEAPKGSLDSLNPVAPLEHLNCFSRGALIRLGDEVGLVPFPWESTGETVRASSARALMRSARRWLRPAGHSTATVARGTDLVFRRVRMDEDD